VLQIAILIKKSRILPFLTDIFTPCSILDGFCMDCSCSKSTGSGVTSVSWKITTNCNLCLLQSDWFINVTDTDSQRTIIIITLRWFVYLFVELLRRQRRGCVTSWWLCYLTPSVWWKREGIPRRPNSRATLQDLDQRSKTKDVVWKMKEAQIRGIIQKVS